MALGISILLNIALVYKLAYPFYAFLKYQEPLALSKFCTGWKDLLIYIGIFIAMTIAIGVLYYSIKDTDD